MTLDLDDREEALSRLDRKQSAFLAIAQDVLAGEPGFQPSR
jgi:hypothetical protein